VSEFQALKAIEELLESYIGEGSVEKALTLYYVVNDGLDYARRRVIVKFGSLRPYIQVLEDLGKLGVTTVPAEARELLKAKEGDVVQLLVRNSREVIDRLDILTRRLVALALRVFENSRRMPEDVEELYNMYEALTGEHLPDDVRKEYTRNLLRLHLVDPDYPSRWTSHAPYILRVLKDKVPEIMFAFKDEQKEERVAGVLGARTRS